MSSGSQKQAEEPDNLSDSPAQPVDLDDLPSDERVLVIRGISGVMHNPSIVEGRTSSTGKTITVPKAIDPDRDDDGSLADSEGVYRLDASTIFSDGLEIRGATTFELYTPLNYRRKQSANHGPGPQAGANGVSDEPDIPSATHLPAPSQDDE